MVVHVDDTYLLTQFFWSTIINSSTDLIPTDISVCKEAFVDGCSCGQCKKDWPQWAQLVIHLSPFFDILCLERYLKTATPHAERHRVHVDVILFCSPIPDIIVLRPMMKIIINSRVLEGPLCVLILEDWHIDLNLPASP